MIEKGNRKEKLLGGLFSVQVGADRNGGVGVDGAIATFDVADDAVFVDDNVGAQGPLKGVALLFVGFEYAVRGEHFLVHVAEEGEFDADLLGESGVCRGTVHAHTENCRVVCINLAGIESRLDRLELLGSTTSEGQDVNGQKDVFLAVKITQFDGFPLITEEREVRGGITDFEGKFGDFVFVLGARGEWDSRGHRS
jgi:hypothetical protein